MVSGTFCVKNSAIQGQNLALTVLCVPNWLDLDCFQTCATETFCLKHGQNLALTVSCVPHSLGSGVCCGCKRTATLL